MKEKNASLKWIIWALGAFLYFYEYLLNISPTVMVSDLMQTFDITASTVGIISAFFLYAYAPMQLFVGILMDHYGLKNLLTISAIIIGIGSLTFGLGNHFWILKLGRFLIGLGSAFGFIGMAYICSHYFSEKRKALVLGLGNSIGMLGAFSGTAVLSSFVTVYGWRSCMANLGIAGFVFALLLYILIKKSQTSHHSTFSHLVRELKNLTKNINTWINGFVALLFYSITSVFGNLWGVPFLQKAYSLTTVEAASCISMIFIGWLVGGPVVGVLSDHYKKRKPIILLGITFCFIALLPLLYAKALPLSAIYILIFLVGFFSSAELLNFTLAVEINPKKVKASSIALTNALISFGGSIIQPAAGFLLDYHWDGQIKEGIRIYSTADYRAALSILPLCLVLSFLLAWTIKEKKHPTSEILEVSN